eukprot:CAMPEP_0116853194 /NCGR_PEP_ID=MMETSP0418-20121206/17763_1 /TAXON_ID=1158023 /ORGANISM="Astrosyne radiata, Strain 13vi08-1A" /LENGTH=68 /DNA_ID=CAMNT_0004485541 /DNA_START=44 /DNA_END=250 /DNA_ORIENTATION=-
MPWQPVPSLLIMFTAFNVTAGVLWGVHKLAYGDRKILRDEWKFALEQRDERVLKYRKLMAKQAASLGK